jgi:hypothetical protein
MRRANHSSRGGLPTVVCRCVCYRNLVNEDVLAHWGLLGQKKKERIYYILCTQGRAYILQLLLNVSASINNVIYCCYKSVNTNYTRKTEEMVSVRFVPLMYFHVPFTTLGLGSTYAGSTQMGLKTQLSRRCSLKHIQPIILFRKLARKCTRVLN